MKRLFVVAAVAVLWTTGSATAQTIPPANAAKVFVTVDAVQTVGNFRIVVTGVVQGESAPSTFYAQPYSISSTDAAQWVANCEHLALMAMAKPGQYLFELQNGTGYPGYVTHSCKLTRVNP